LVLVGAPLGNVGDASARLRAALAEADVIAAEDTRRLRRLARELDVTPSGRVISYFDGNEQARADELIELVAAGQTVAVITDGGMPSVSDPGYRLVRAAIDRGLPIGVVPGPSAVTTALAVSGLPCDRFCFEGFPPRKPAERRAAFAALATEPRTMVFFEAPHRIAATLTDLVAAFGASRPAALCRELTKTYEEVRRGSLGSLIESVAAQPARGEITLVVAGSATAAAAADAELVAAVADRVAAGQSRRDAIATVALSAAVSRRHLYDLVVNPQPASGD
jgi:16S rRNA (cytidine1402-2'-O)-methyltransferase